MDTLGNGTSLGIIPESAKKRLREKKAASSIFRQMVDDSQNIIRHATEKNGDIGDLLDIKSVFRPKNVGRR